MATYDLTSSVPAATSIVQGDILNCPYSGAALTINLPVGYYKLECWGAGGYYSRGGYSTGILYLSEPKTLYLLTGGAGAMTTSTNTITAGGFNGGGNAYTTSTSSNANRGYSGGGASDIRIGTNSLYARVIVAGGGGGNYNRNYGYGGGEIGGTGYSGGSSFPGGTGGSQTEPGISYSGTTRNPTATFTVAAFGTGASAKAGQSGDGGGGGWYGGGGAGQAATAGGGSGYVYTSETAINYPSGCLLTNDYYLSGAYTVDGSQSIIDPDGTTTTGHLNDGYIRITAQKVYQLVAIPTLANKVYNGAEQSPTETNYNSNYMTKIGTFSATNPGAYYITYILKNGYCWSDFSIASKTILWEITSNFKRVWPWIQGASDDLIIGLDRVDPWIYDSTLQNEDS